MQSPSFIVNIYQQLRDANMVSSCEDFSKRLLKKSPNYLTAFKAQGRDVNTVVLLELLEELTTTRELLSSSMQPNAVLEQRYEKWRGIEEQIAEEIALRTTKRATIASPALKSVIHALHTISSQRNAYEQRAYG
jgi:hypothetical protein